MPDSLTIVIPTYHEAENIELLVGRISNALEGVEFDWDVIIVDDNSQDRTVEICEPLKNQHPLQLIVRTRDKGLSSAVVAGMTAAKGDFLLCMDADLSHPPEAIPEIYESLKKPSCDFVIGSRYVAGGTTDDDWGLFRWLNSVIATGLAKPLTSAKDPMAGYFALKKSDFSKAFDQLDPIGYKIGLELIVKCQCQNVDEVPIHFADRQFGESKLSLKEQLNYIRHLKKLYNFKFPELTRFIRFGFVGISGIFVNLAALSLLLATAILPPLAMAVAIWVAMTWNFFINRKYTFLDCANGRLSKQYVQFCLASLTGAVLNWSVATYLWKAVPLFSELPTAAGLCGILAGMLLNFTLCKKFVFTKGQTEVDAGHSGSKKSECSAKAA